MRKRYIKTLCMMLILTLLFSVSPISSVLATDTYDGTASPWAIEEIQDARGNDLTYDDILSDFTRPITREEFCIVSLKLYEKLSGEIIEPTESPFSDTNNPEIIKANMLGIVLGTGDGNFSPEKNITRQELSLMTYRALDKALPHMSKVLINNLPIADEEEIASWAREAVAYCFDRGIVKGVGEGVFDPLSNTTREQSIAIINRTYVSHKETSINKGGNDKTGDEEGTKPGENRLNIPDLKGTMRWPIDKLQLSRTIMKPGDHNPIKDFKISDRNMPTIVLENGKVFPLEPEDFLLGLKGVDFSNITTTPKSVLDMIMVPESISGVRDLRGYQTSIKNQDGRGTCVSFAFCAAMEAAYIKLDPVKYENIDLSEQYLHHMQNTSALPGLLDGWVFKKRFTAEGRENYLGRWWGGNMITVMAMLADKYGVPEEKDMPYIGGKAYEDENFGHKDLTPDKGGNQILINGINLSISELPREVFLNATYGIKEWAAIPENKLKDPTQYEAVLNAGYEIIIAFKPSGNDPTPKDNIWDPGNGEKEKFGHAMLLVGYDRNNRVFIAKNSWGYDNKDEGGFTLFSYDWATKGNIATAMYITKVIENPNINAREKQKFIGRWRMALDGNKYTLDVNRIPLFYLLDWCEPLKIYHATPDYRLGSFTYMPENKNVELRANGNIHRNSLHFYADLESKGNYDVSIDALKGARFDMCMFADNPQLMVGQCDYKGDFRTFYCYTGSVNNDPYPAPYTGNKKMTPEDFKGYWDINRDGNKGLLHITSIADTNIEAIKDVKGTYSEDGKLESVKGTLELRFDYNTKDYLYNTLFLKIPLKDGTTMDLTGSMLWDKKSIMCGLYKLDSDKNNHYPWIGESTVLKLPEPKIPIEIPKPPIPIEIPKNLNFN